MPRHDAHGCRDRAEDEARHAIPSSAGRGTAAYESAKELPMPKPSPTVTTQRGSSMASKARSRAASMLRVSGLATKNPDGDAPGQVEG